MCDDERHRASRLNEILGEIELKHKRSCRLPQTTLHSTIFVAIGVTVCLNVSPERTQKFNRQDVSPSLQIEWKYDSFIIRYDISNARLDTRLADSGGASFTYARRWRSISRVTKRASPLPTTPSRISQWPPQTHRETYC